MSFDLPRFVRRAAPAAAALLALGAGSALAQRSTQTAPSLSLELPAAKKILKRYTKASGGDAAKTHENRVQKGTFSIPAQGLTGSFTTYSAPPNKFLNVITLAMIGEMRQGYDGTTAWSSDPMQGPRVLSADELEGMLMEANFDSDLTTIFPDSKTLARETFEGRESWKVSMKSAGGAESIGWFDEATGLLNGLQRTVKSPMGEIQVKVVLSDYATMSGMTVPKTTTMQMAGMEQVMTLTEVMVNVPGLPSFTPPPEVQALMKGGE